MSEKHFNIRVKGKVQNVFFRASAKEEADKLGLKGFAQNESEGSVYIEAEGDEDSLKEFIKWCASGPARSVVTEMKTEEGAIKSFTEFGIKR